MRSYAAIGREFPFPIDFEREAITPRNHAADGQQTLEHIDAAFPLWRRQQEILKILIEDRREHHRDLKNAGRNMKTFASGDLVLVKRQVQTTQEKGPAKARMQARGPYRILEQIKPGTYRIQRLTAIQGAGRRGRVTKESAARLTRIPSTLVLHKPAEGIDTRLATYRHAMIDNPLENILGLHEPGRHRQAAENRPLAYDKIEDLWHEDIDNNWPLMQAPGDDTDSSSSNEDSDTTVDDDDDDNNQNGHQDDDHNINNQDNPESHENTQNDQEKDDNINTGNTGDSINNNVDESNTNTNARRANPSTRDNVTTPHPKKRKTATPPHSAPPTRTSTRTAKRPARYQQDTPPAITTPQDNAQNTQRHAAHKLYKRICKSRDKLFFIKYKADTTNVHRWYVVQAKLQEDDKEQTRNEGIYTVWFYIREHQNSKSRTIRNCRFWPEVHQTRPNGMLGPIVPIRAGRVQTIIQEQPHKYKIYEHSVNLCTNTLVGPFDFAVPKHYQNEANRIAFEEWEDLKTAAAQHNIDVSDIEEIIPLR